MTWCFCRYSWGGAKMLAGSQGWWPGSGLVVALFSILSLEIRGPQLKMDKTNKSKNSQNTGFWQHPYSNKCEETKKGGKKELKVTQVKGNMSKSTVNFKVCVPSLILAIPVFGFESSSHASLGFFSPHDFKGPWILLTVQRTGSQLRQPCWSALCNAARRWVISVNTQRRSNSAQFILLDWVRLL